MDQIWGVFVFLGGAILGPIAAFRPVPLPLKNPVCAPGTHGPSPGFCGAQHERPNVKAIYCGARCGSHPKDVRCRFRALPRFWGKFDISSLNGPKTLPKKRLYPATPKINPKTPDCKKTKIVKSIACNVAHPLQLIVQLNVQIARSEHSQPG